MLEYKKERLEFSDKAHSFAKELTEAVDAYLNDIKGDEVRESLDVAMVVGSMLMGGDKQANIEILIDGVLLFSINAGKSALEDKDETTV